ncbi:hypothetical protein ALQ20_02959 [Pseudomonas syringae pv. atrofaciens]|uniref:hypothetical protein n=1 Tax=Pseudomonas syringae TaxID=317 RepID=UPI000F3AF333|nr:hypothetical protein [Pseudomonas syringae]RMP73278.1 hypothetical protein ALQ20_02959 [Pseudomonas syringae pv. atrofaciens]
MNKYEMEEAMENGDFGSGFDHEAAAKAGLFGVPIDELDDESLNIIDAVSKGE